MIMMREVILGQDRNMRQAADASVTTARQTVGFGSLAKSSPSTCLHPSHNLLTRLPMECQATVHALRGSPTQNLCRATRWRRSCPLGPGELAEEETDTLSLKDQDLKRDDRASPTTLHRRLPLHASESRSQYVILRPSRYVIVDASLSILPQWSGNQLI